MDTPLVIVRTVVVTLLVVGVAWFAWSRWRSGKLKESFGPEYDRTVQKEGNRSRAEKDLRERQKRVEKYDLRPLSDEEKRRFATRWEDVQREFVDRPEGAVADANQLVEEAMQARGYPVGDINRQEEDLSVENPDVVEHYRRARAIAARNAEGIATTEDLRQSMKHYREIFESILERGSSSSRDEKAEKEVRKVV